MALRVQSAGATTGATPAQQLTVTLPLPPIVGNLLVLVADITVQFADLAGWTQALLSFGSGPTSALWYKLAELADQSVTVHSLQTLGDYNINAVLREYAAASTLQAATKHEGTGQNTTSWSAGSLTGVGPGVAVAAVCFSVPTSHGKPGSTPVNPSWTNGFDTQVNEATSYSGGSNIGVFSADKLLDAAGDVETTATWTNAAYSAEGLLAVFN